MGNWSETGGRQAVSWGDGYEGADFCPYHRTRSVSGLAAGFVDRIGKDKNMQKLTVCIAALAGMVFGIADGSSAWAKSVDLEQVHVSGEARAVPRVEEGGQSVPLRHALEQIVPPAYSINMPNAGPWADVPVSWHARVPFVVALREALAADPTLIADVDVRLRLVTVRANASAAGNAPSEDAGLAMRHVWGLPSDANAPAQPAAPTVPVLKAQPALLAAMQSVPAPMPQAIATSRPNVPSTATVPGAANVPSTATVPGAANAPSTPSSPTNPRAVAAAVSVPAASDPHVDPPPAPSEPIRTWHLSLADHTVKTVLTRWAKEDGWQLVWDVPVDFGVDAEATVTGTFEQALEAVVEALKRSDTPSQAILYRGNKVLRIVAKGAA